MPEHRSKRARPGTLQSVPSLSKPWLCEVVPNPARWLWYIQAALCLNRIEPGQAARLGKADRVKRASSGAQANDKSGC